MEVNVALIDEILADQAQPKAVCVFGKILAQQTEEGRKEIQEVLDSEIAATQISAALMRYRGIAIPAQGVRRHRRGECSCR